MNSSNPNPTLPSWIFIATDLALIGAAAVIALLSPHPLSTGAMLWIVALVGLGAIAGLLPLVVRYERQKNEALDERQQSLEALARTVSSSAEQISIAANGLHQVTELAHRNLRAAEQLPHKLQEKIAEFQAQLSAAADVDKEELERELLALRTTESERLESVSQRIAKSSAEWTKLEAATHQHLTAANDAVSKLAFGTANAIGKAQAAAEQALSQARVEAARTIGEASGNATRAIDAAKSAALADLDARLAAASTLLVERVTAGLNASLAAIARPTAPGDPAPAPRTEAPPAAVQPAAGAVPVPAPDPSPPKRPRKPRREDPAATPTSPDETAAPVESNIQGHGSSAGAEDAPPPSAEEPPPIPSDKIAEITPVAPPTTDPFVAHLIHAANGGTHAPGQTSAPMPSTTTPKSPKKSAGKKPGAEEEPVLGLQVDEPAEDFTSRAPERVLTSDGATRLLVTAYIGIGNRLFIRGQGPGLSWEKGVPLQFVSIGKWRWETNEASTPVRFKLYKNDDLECAALGAQSLDPGHQQEVTAAFQ